MVQNAKMSLTIHIMLFYIDILYGTAQFKLDKNLHGIFTRTTQSLLDSSRASESTIN